MFTPDDRERLKDVLIRRAEEDDRVVAAALLGSSSTGGEDEFSDIDLALSIDAGEVEATTEDWTRFMHDDAGAVHHLDVRFGATVYRVFLLPDSLQVDLSFWISSEFVATGPRFRPLFGEPPFERPLEPDSLDALVGEAWLYLIHARSSLGRERHWQAVHMISGVRDRVLELACRRHGLRPDEARGVDDLPPACLTTTPHCYRLRRRSRT